MTADVMMEGLPLLHRGKDRADGLHAQNGKYAGHSAQGNHQRHVPQHAFEVRHKALGNMEGKGLDGKLIVHRADHLRRQVEDNPNGNDAQAHQAGHNADLQHDIGNLEHHINLPGGRSQFIHHGFLL